MKRALSTLIGACVLLASTAAFAQEYGGGYSAGYSQQRAQPRRAFYPSGVDNIGNAGQFTISVERLTGVFFDHASYDGTTHKSTHLALLANNGGSTSSAPRVAFDYFVIDGLSVGGSIAYWSHAPSGGSAVKQFLFSPRIGYAYAFDDTFSLWPRVAFTYSHESSSVSTYNASGSRITASTSGNLTQLSLEGMVGISPIKHVAFLVGPYADIGVGGSASGPDSITGNAVSVDQKLTSFGLAVDIVAYF